MSVRIGTVSTQVDTETAPDTPGPKTENVSMTEEMLRRASIQMNRNARRTRAAGFDEGFDD